LLIILLIRFIPGHESESYVRESEIRASWMTGASAAIGAALGLLLATPVAAAIHTDRGQDWAYRADPAGAAGTVSGQPQTMLLWPNSVPGSQGKPGAESVRLNALGEHIVSNVHTPSISVTLPKPDKATGAAVIVIPGGGHVELWMDHEGYAVAAYLADHGIAAFVVKYRLAHAPGSTYTVEGDSLADIKRAIRLVRSQALQWHVDPGRVGVMGFSAGGELAALAATRYDDGVGDAADPVERQSSRPNFQALLYPAIPKELRLSKQTPPAFLLAGSDDGVSQGLASLYVEFRKAGVPAELHLYDGVGHGFGLRSSNSGPVAAWPQRFLDWLQARGIISRTAD
jgi:acetyl esterase/lipase